MERESLHKMEGIFMVVEDVKFTKFVSNMFPKLVWYQVYKFEVRIFFFKKIR